MRGERGVKAYFASTRGVEAYFARRVAGRVGGWYVGERRG